MSTKFNILPPKPEYLVAVIDVLDKADLMSLKEIAQNCRLTQTQAGCALDKLVEQGKVSITRQNKSPKVQYRREPTANPK